MENLNYSEKIKAERKLKGLTQQELANETGLSLRTIQRIEKGTEEISGYSLKQISKILDIPLEQIIMQNVNQVSIDKSQIGSVKNLYLSSLAFLFNPIFGLIIPAIMGFSKQNKNDFYKKNLKDVLLIHLIGLLSVLLLIIYVIISEYLNIALIQPLQWMFDSMWFLLIPIIYYIIIGGIIIYKIYKLSKYN